MADSSITDPKVQKLQGMMRSLRQRRTEMMDPDSNRGRDHTGRILYKLIVDHLKTRLREGQLSVEADLSLNDLIVEAVQQDLEEQGVLSARYPIDPDRLMARWQEHVAASQAQKANVHFSGSETRDLHRAYAARISAVDIPGTFTSIKLLALLILEDLEALVPRLQQQLADMLAVEVMSDLLFEEVEV